MTELDLAWGVFLASAVVVLLFCIAALIGIYAYTQNGGTDD